MKSLQKLCSGGILCSALALHAADGGIDWHQWTLYHHPGLTPETAAALTVCAPVPEIDGKKLTGRDVRIPAEGIDLNGLIGYKVPAEAPALLVKTVTAGENREIRLGMAVDWWFECFCNGETVFSTLRSGGNIDWPPRAEDHAFTLRLKKGSNIITVLARSDSAGVFTAAAAEMPASRPPECISRRNVLEGRVPSRAALRQGPYLIGASAGEVTVVFLTDGAAGGGVEYRKKGKTAWRKQWDTIGGILRDHTDTHRITLKDLEPGAKYEYRVLVASGNGKFLKGTICGFTAPPAGKETFTFFVTGDTQFGSGRRGKLIAGWRELIDQADFQVTVGDLSSIFDDFDLTLFGGYMNWLSPETFHGKPFAAVRGNHELRGAERCRWFDLLGPASGTGYYAFRYGTTLFVVLDTGGDGTDMKNNSMTAGAMKQYMAEQRQWVEKLVASPEYAAADYRIVLSHDAPHSHRLSEIRNVAVFLSEPLVKAAASPERRIHLWLSGHIHRYRRSVPSSTGIYANYPTRAEEVRKPADAADTAEGGRYPFPIVTVEGPGQNGPLETSATTVKVSPERIEVKTFDDKNRCFDHFFIAPDGRVTEVDDPYKRQMLKLYP